MKKYLQGYKKLKDYTPVEDRQERDLHDRTMRNLSIGLLICFLLGSLSLIASATSSYAIELSNCQRIGKAHNIKTVYEADVKDCIYVPSSK